MEQLQRASIQYRQENVAQTCEVPALYVNTEQMIPQVDSTLFYPVLKISPILEEGRNIQASRLTWRRLTVHTTKALSYSFFFVSKSRGSRCSYPSSHPIQICLPTCDMIRRTRLSSYGVTDSPSYKSQGCEQRQRRFSLHRSVSPD
jgi:hypothetical protein